MKYTTYQIPKHHQFFKRAFAPRTPGSTAVSEGTNGGGRIKAPKVASGVDDVTLERLKAIGYVEE